MNLFRTIWKNPQGNGNAGHLVFLFCVCPLQILYGTCRKRCNIILLTFQNIWTPQVFEVSAINDRPPPGYRRFVSPIVDAAIANISTRMTDPDLGTDTPGVNLYNQLSYNIHKLFPEYSGYYRIFSGTWK